MKDRATTYEGQWSTVSEYENELNVLRNGEQRISHRNDLWNHSPTGLNIGYGGSGPAQCALAIVADFVEHDHAALRLYQDFKAKIIAKLPQGKDFVISGAEILGALGEGRVERAIHRAELEDEEEKILATLDDDVPREQYERVEARLKEIHIALHELDHEGARTA